MPQTIAELVYYISAAITPILVTVIGVLVWWGFTKLSDKVDRLIEGDVERRVEIASFKVSLVDHIDNKGVHCKGADCPRITV